MTKIIHNNHGPTLAQMLLHLYHTDKANAAMHAASVKFSPLTFMVSDLVDNCAVGGWYTDEIRTIHDEVRYHRGQYELDGGR